MLYHRPLFRETDIRCTFVLLDGRTPQKDALLDDYLFPFVNYNYLPTSISAGLHAGGAQMQSFQ